jgi:hypothetical protein
MQPASAFLSGGRLSAAFVIVCFRRALVALVVFSGLTLGYAQPAALKPGYPPREAGLLYASSFEASEGFTPGDLHLQQDWEVIAGVARVAGTGAAAGSQGLVLSSGMVAAHVEREFAPQGINPVVIFVDFYAKPAAGNNVENATVVDVDSARFAVVKNGSSGLVRVLDGDGFGSGLWKDISADLALAPGDITADWHRFTVRLNFPARTWDLSLNGKLVAHDFRFRLGRATYFSWFSFKGRAVASARLDGFYAGVEHPLFKDVDRDGLADAWEIEHALNTTLDDRSQDVDGDSLSNVREFRLGTNPRQADSDGDGLVDAEEVRLSTNPLSKDSDGDGMPDGWEIAHALNPLVNDAGENPDGDGLTNLAEFRARRLPKNRSDAMMMPSGVQLILRVPSGQHRGVNTNTWRLSPVTNP